ncbi:hypothetical protein NHX12_002103 [Muraenolepis orangiensis]|uniref:MAM domain-containing protein n=1 Tax=Muraenolepis orangiensis TaxID=630683 RepID=A0A9Q0E0Y6_9TELE|nr:hypothetical protein NHX12_002103 [Muraenolepis orangiensis]
MPVKSLVRALIYCLFIGEGDYELIPYGYVPGSLKWDFKVPRQKSAGCTFDEDSDPNLCDIAQGEEDDFDWQLFRTHNAPHTSADLLRGSTLRSHAPDLWSPLLCHHE